MTRRKNDKALVVLVVLNTIVLLLDLAAHVNFVLTVQRGKEILSVLEGERKPRRSWLEDTEQ